MPRKRNKEIKLTSNFLNSELFSSGTKTNINTCYKTPSNLRTPTNFIMPITLKKNRVTRSNLTENSVQLPRVYSPENLKTPTKLTTKTRFNFKTEKDKTKYNKIITQGLNKKQLKHLYLKSYTSIKKVPRDFIKENLFVERQIIQKETQTQLYNESEVLSDDKEKKYNLFKRDSSLKKLLGKTYDRADRYMSFNSKKNQNDLIKFSGSELSPDLFYLANPGSIVSLKGLKYGKKKKGSGIIDFNSTTPKLFDFIDSIPTKKKPSTKEEKLERWTKVMASCAKDFKKLKMSLTFFYSSSLGKHVAYDHPKAMELFMCIRQGNKKKFYKLLQDESDVVFSFDYFNQTILHWLAKRNLYDWISYALSKGAIINSTDLAGRTPLHVAVVNNSIESVMVLLYEMAYPSSQDNSGKVPVDLTKNESITVMLKRCVLLYLIHAMGKPEQFEENVKRGLEFLYTKELHFNFSKDSFCIYS